MKRQAIVIGAMLLMLLPIATAYSEDCTAAGDKPDSIRCCQNYGGFSFTNDGVRHNYCCMPPHNAKNDSVCVTEIKDVFCFNGGIDPDCGELPPVSPGTPCQSDNECQPGENGADLYCSKTNPNTGISVEGHCCTKNQYWDNRIQRCFDFNTCSPPFSTNPFQGIQPFGSSYQACCPAIGVPGNVNVMRTIKVY